MSASDGVRLGTAQENFGVRGHDELAAPRLGDVAEMVEDLALKDEVKVSVRLVEEQHRRRAGIEESQQQQHLMEAAARVRNVEPRSPLVAWTEAHRPILADDVGVGIGELRR